MGQGEFALVRHHLEIAVNQTGEWVGDHDMYTTLVDTATLECNEAAIRQYAPRAEELANSLGHRLYQAIVHRAWGVAHRLASEYAESEERLHRALVIFSELGTPWQRGRTLFELGELAKVRQQTAVARDFFSRALTDFEVMQARPDSARTRHVLSEMSARLAV
jgi:hypothetical protein